MSQQNKRVLQEANAAIEKGDYEGFLEHCTEDTTWRMIGDQVLEGKDAVRKWMAATYDRPPQFNVTDLIAQDDFVAACGKITLPDDSGSPVDYAYCDVWRLRDGKLAELRAYVVKE